MLAALIVGALTAWYLGLQVGIIAAVVTLVALIVAGFVPGLTLAVYALVLAWSAALYFLGPKLSRQGGPKVLPSILGSVPGHARAWIDKLLRRDERRDGDRPSDRR